MIEPITATSMRRDYMAWWNRWPDDGLRIIAIHAMEHGVTVADLTGCDRRRALVRVRQDCMARLRRETGLSLPAIGRLFGRDHTTVLHSLRAHELRRSAS